MAHFIYANELTATFKCGYPLWEPDCDPEVAIADVGYIRDGQFCRLFNASLPRGHPKNREFGEPDGYEPLEAGAIQERTPHPAGVMASRSVSKLGADMGFSGSILEAGAGFHFSCKKDRGAILIINSEANRTDALRTLAFKEYLIKHYKSWHRLANNAHNARGINVSDLVFVTGHDSTADWAMAAFKEQSQSGGVSFQAGYPAIAGAQFSIWGSWKQASSIHSHCGPRIPRPARTIAESESTGVGSKQVCAADLKIFNQCIFLRGFRVMEKKAYVQRKFSLKAPSSSGGLDDVPQPWFSRSSSTSEFSDTSSQSKGRSNSTGGSIGRTHSQLSNSAVGDNSTSGEMQIKLNVFQRRAPSEVSLEHQLEKSNGAQLAVAHKEVPRSWALRSSSGSSGFSDAGSLNKGHLSSNGGRKHPQLYSSAVANYSEPDEVQILSNHPQEHAPIEALLEYIFEKSDTASLAVAHDDDLADILQDDGDGTDFGKLIRASGISIDVDSQGIGTVNVEEHNKPSIPHPQPPDEYEPPKKEKPLPSSPESSGRSTPTVAPGNTPRVPETQLYPEKQQFKRPPKDPEVADSRRVTPSHKSTSIRKTTGSPNSQAYHAEQEHINVEIDTLQTRLAAVQERISLTTKTGRGADRRNALRAELNALRDQQLAKRSERDVTSAELKTVQEVTRKMVKDLQSTVKKLPARTTEDVDAQIRGLERRVESGTIGLSEEKAVVRQISSLRRARTAIENSQAIQADIDAHRAHADILRKQLGSESAVAIATRMDTVREELETLRRDGDAAFAERGSLYKERTDLQTRLSELHEQRRRAVERFRAGREESRRKADEERAQVAAKARADRAAQEEQRRIQAQERLLEKARAPAFAAEIHDCRSLLEYFSSVDKGEYAHAAPLPSSSVPPSGEAKHQLRQPSENHPEAWEGWVPLKKKAEDSYFVGGKGKAKKGHRKGATATAGGSAKISIPLGIVSTLLSQSISPPAVAAAVPQTMEELRRKIEWYEANQKRVTEENVARTKADLQRIANPMHMRSNPMSVAS